MYNVKVIKQPDSPVRYRPIKYKGEAEQMVREIEANGGKAEIVKIRTLPKRAI